MVEALVSALRAVGCPADTARELAREVRVERSPQQGDELMVLLGGHGVGVGLPVQRDHVEEAVWSLVQNVAAENAEAHERAARGEPGWAPFWPLPDRR
jgi:hypothetical protein